jgi:hypothetical protein
MKDSKKISLTENQTNAEFPFGRIRVHYDIEKRTNAGYKKVLLTFNINYIFTQTVFIWRLTLS